MQTHDHEFGFEDYVHLPGWEQSEAIQLTRGRMRVRRQKAVADGIALSVCRSNAATLMRDVYSGDAIAISGIVGGEETASYKGMPLLEETLMVWRAGSTDEHHYSIPKGSIDFYIEIPESTAAVMGWQFSEPLINLGSCSVMDGFVTACMQLVGAAQGTSKAEASASADSLINSIDQILGAQRSMDMESWHWKTHASSLEVFEAAAALLEPETQGVGALRADELANRLGLSRRSLFAHFRRWPGMGPTTYLAILRLHRLRNRLLAAEHAATTVTREALEVGITHMGRLSADYRAQFGELPSETLRRSGRDNRI